MVPSLPHPVFLLMQAVRKEGELTWIAERRLLCKRLQLLQQAVARLENDKHGLKQHNMQLRGALEQVRLQKEESDLVHVPPPHFPVKFKPTLSLIAHPLR